MQAVMWDIKRKQYLEIRNTIITLHVNLEERDEMWRQAKKQTPEHIRLKHFT